MPSADRKPQTRGRAATRLFAVIALCGGLNVTPTVFDTVLSPVASVHAQDQTMIAPLFFTGVIGGDSAQGRRVLLRWYAGEEMIDLESSIIYRTDAEGNRVRLSVIRKSRNPALIQSIFWAPGADAARADMQRILQEIYGTAGNTPEEFVAYLVDFLDGGGPGDTARARRLFATQYNYGIATMEGLAYLDHVDPAQGPFTYELWQGDSTGTAQNALGLITLDASVIDVLPAPQKLVEVFLRGRDGVSPARANHRRIFLNWNPGDEPDIRHISFGYNVYKLEREIAAGETFESVRSELIRINDTPIMAPSPIEGEQDDQTYLFADSGSWLDTESDDDLLPVGATYTYFAVARDLLGQEGHPSEPLIATVRDTFEPDTPRGINVIVLNVNNQPALEVSWLPVADVDVASYRVYRYQEYVNVGHKGPFAPIDGMAEGLIADLPAAGFPPEMARLRHLDTTIQATHHERIFWYSLSAVDEHGNESALSPGAFGVIDDVEGPQAIGISRVCRTITTPEISARVQLESEGTQEFWNPLFILNREHYLANSVRIYRVYPIITPGKAATEEVELIGDYNLDARGPVFAHDGPMVLDFSNGTPPIYRFEIITADNRTTTIDVAPPDRWRRGASPRAVYIVDARVGATRGDCTEVAILDPVTGTTIPGMDIPPIQFQAPCPEDTVSMRLLRSVNGGRNWNLVSEFPCNFNLADLVDNYHPESLTRARYALVALDRHGNPGPPHYLPIDVVFLGQVSPPAPFEAEALGANIPGQRRIRLKWQGPADAIEYYRVHITPKAPQNLEALAVETFPLEFSVAQARSDSPDPGFSYDEATGVFTMTTGIIDRLGTTIDGTQEYELRIQAVPFAGAAVSGTRTLSVHWENMDIGVLPMGQLRWAPRPLPPVVGRSNKWNAVGFDNQLGGGSVLIPITSNIGDTPAPYPDPPYMLWRRRIDRANQPWVPVTPYIPEIRRNGFVVEDPFFTVESGNIWILDNTGIVQSAEYRYYVMTFDPVTREMLGLWGPYDFLALTPQ